MLQFEKGIDLFNGHLKFVTESNNSVSRINKEKKIFPTHLQAILKESRVKCCPEHNVCKSYSFLRNINRNTIHASARVFFCAVRPYWAFVISGAQSSI